MEDVAIPEKSWPLVLLIFAFQQMFWGFFVTFSVHVQHFSVFHAQICIESFSSSGFRFYIVPLLADSCNIKQILLLFHLLVKCSHTAPTIHICLHFIKFPSRHVSLMLAWPWTTLCHNQVTDKEN